MSYVIGAPCIDVLDNSCMEECPVDCIYPGERMNYINPVECIDCGACEAVCPVDAIQPGHRLTPEWLPFREAAKEVFATVGNPGGSSRHPEPVPDSEVVRRYVPAG